MSAYVWLALSIGCFAFSGYCFRVQLRTWIHRLVSAEIAAHADSVVQQGPTPHLIDATPDLLKALKSLVEQFDVYRAGWTGGQWVDRIGLLEDLNSARAAIAKAEGR